MVRRTLAPALTSHPPPQTAANADAAIAATAVITAIVAAATADLVLLAELMIATICLLRSWLVLIPLVPSTLE